MVHEQGRQVRIIAGAVELEGSLELPERPHGMVLFVHGSGSGRFSPRNQEVARVVAGRGLGTLLFDLLTPEEAELDGRTRQLRFDLDLLSSRVVDALGWIARQPDCRTLRVGLYGSSTGAAAALIAAQRRPDQVSAIVSRGGRVDLAGQALGEARAPTLLIVGGADSVVLDLNREALDLLPNKHSRLAIVPGAGHLFEEPGALTMVARLAADWFEEWLLHEVDRPAAPRGVPPPDFSL